MTEQKQDRPATLNPPRPAPDENIDPVDPPAPAKKAPRKVVASTAKRGELYSPPAPKQTEPDYNLSTRISPQVRATLRQITNTGISQRAAIEHAIMHTYGKEGKQA